MTGPERALVINELAQQDYLDILKQSVRSWGRQQARQYKDSLDASMQRLLEFPDLGRATPELFDGGHRLKSRHHVIYYTYSAHAVIIHRILHERRHVTPAMLLPDFEG